MKNAQKEFEDRMDQWALNSDRVIAQSASYGNIGTYYLLNAAGKKIRTLTYYWQTNSVKFNGEFTWSSKPPVKYGCVEKHFYLDKEWDEVLKYLREWVTLSP